MTKRYRTAKGREVDIEAMRAAGERAVALGNMGVNGRGDKISRGGKVIETSQERVRAYNTDNPKAVRRVSIKGDYDTDADQIQGELPKTKSDKLADKKGKPTAKKATVEVELEDGSIEIVDADTNTDDGEEL